MACRLTEQEKRRYERLRQDGNFNADPQLGEQRKEI